MCKHGVVALNGRRIVHGFRIILFTKIPEQSQMLWHLMLVGVMLSSDVMIMIYYQCIENKYVENVVTMWVVLWSILGTQRIWEAVNLLPNVNVNIRMNNNDKISKYELQMWSKKICSQMNLFIYLWFDKIYIFLKSWMRK